MRLLPVVLSLGLALPLAAQTPVAKPDPQKSYTEYALGKWAETQAETKGGSQYIEAALQHYTAAMAADPQSAFLASEMADLLSRLGRTSDAISLMQSTLKSHPDSIAAHTTLGEIYLRELSRSPQPLTDANTHGALGAALAEYKALIRLDPQQAQNVVVLGKLYGASGQPELAEEQFRAALRVAPTNMDALASLVQSLAGQNKLDDARQEIAALPPVARSAQVYATLGDAFVGAHRYSDAAAAFQQAVEARPDDADLQKALGSALMDGHQYPEALKVYQSLRQQLPDDGAVALRLGQLQMQMAQWDAARASLQSARTLLGPDDVESAYAQALLDQSTGHDPQALEGLKKLVARKNSPASQSIFLTQLARLEMHMGKYADAQAHLSQLQALGAAYRDRALNLEIELYAEQRHYPEALQAARQALAAQPDSRPLHITYANLLSASGDATAARAALQPLMKGSAADWDLYLALGQIDLAANRFPQAESDTRRAGQLAANPTDQARAITQLGLIAAKQKDFAAAEQQYHKALALTPDDAATLNALGYLLAEQGVHLPEALGYVQQALAQDANNGAYLDSLGWIYF
ncbi:MAG TPA: tetratricopeptide repeat protein, partial [Terriglobales bacterium]|nr:tetratricopeptide repeat protein [Terriglobales bacterium]